jgi:hypothetical protein
MTTNESMGFSDWLSEQHAIAVAELIRPLLVNNWKLYHRGIGRYLLKRHGWVDEFDLVFKYQDAGMSAAVSLRVFPTYSRPLWHVDTIPIEHPNTIELLTQFLADILLGYNTKCKILINHPIILRNRLVEKSLLGKVNS